jgi:hypothetical protein
MVKYVSIVFIIFLIFFFLSPLFSYAQTELTVTIQVGVTNLNLSGRASPQAQITVLENNAVIGTTTADSSGNFSKTLQGMEAGIHSISIYSTDTNGETTSTIIYSLSLSLGTETTLSNIIMPSTVVLSGDGIAKGDTLKISGLGVPLSTITIFINNTTNTLTKTATSGVDGSWEYNFNTSELDVGDRNLYVKISTSDGYQSESSEIKDFSILTASTVTSVSAAATPGPVATSTLVPEKIVCLLPSLIRTLYDPNNNCRIEKEEIFTVVKFWTEEWRGFIKEVYAAGLEGEIKAFQKCDFNRDNACNLVDLSILLFYIER